MEYFMPKDSNQVMTDVVPQAQNLSLRLLKMINIKEDKGAKVIDKPKLFSITQPACELSRIVNMRQKENMVFLKETGYTVLTTKLKLNSKLAIGLGNASVYETNLQLHHVYGVPYIPASALKGIASAWLYDQEGQESEDLKSLIGTEDQRAQIIFFDAFPTGTVRTGVDYMTPHYTAYYNGKQAPNDTESPVPIPFYVIEQADFCFSVAGRDDVMVQKAMALLKQALIEGGVGAKTSVGYGVFK